MSDERCNDLYFKMNRMVDFHRFCLTQKNSETNQKIAAKRFQIINNHEFDLETVFCLFI